MYSNEARYLTEEIYHLNRCQIDGCGDDIIPDPNGIDRHCFKHQIDLDL